MAQAVVGVMGPVSLGVLTGCLSALRWLLVAAVVLILMLAAKQWWTGEGVTFALLQSVPLFAAVGSACGFAAKRLSKANSG